MSGYYYLKERSDGDFDHISVDTDGVETVISVIPVADKDYPWGRPSVDELENKNRAIRNVKLSETEWWAVQDRTMTQAEKDYRQALRDIPSQSGFPTEITWPTKPE